MKRSLGIPRGGHLDGDLLSAYLDGQVTADERRRVEAHLGSCAVCQHELESLRSTVALLAALPRVPLPRAFTLSEAQVGIRRPTGQPVWLGGLLRGLAAVSAVALVAVMAAVLLRPSGTPVQNLARVAAPARTAPTQKPAAAAPEAQPAAPANAATEAPAPQALAAQKAPASPTASLVAATSGETAQPATQAPEPTRTSAPQIDQAVPPPAPAAAAPQPSPAKPAAPAAATAMTARAAAQPSTAAPTAAAAPASSASQPGMAVAAGKGSGGPAPTAVSTALSELPQGSVLVYADTQGLWAVDRSTGVRSLVAAQGITQPEISSDRNWVAYEQARDGAHDVWGVPWVGGTPKLLLAESDLNTGLPESIRARQIQDMRWLPGKQALAVTVLAQPVAQGEAPSLELWRVDLATAQHRLLATGDPRHQPVAAPNGSQVAFFRREPDKAAEGSVWLVDVDGSGERVVLRFPARPDQRSYAEQISWLPDSSAFWVAIPDSTLDRPEPLNGLTLYRVPLQGEAQPVGRADAHQAYWSPDGKRLAYVRYAGDAAGPRDLYVAAADGSNPQLQTAIGTGQFVSWSPDSARYLYEANGQLQAGAPGQQAQPLGTDVSEAQWLGPDQVVYLSNQGGPQQLTLATVSGQAIPLQTTSGGATFDSQP